VYQTELEVLGKIKLNIEMIPGTGGGQGESFYNAEDPVDEAQINLIRSINNLTRRTRRTKKWDVTEEQLYTIEFMVVRNLSVPFPWWKI